MSMKEVFSNGNLVVGDELCTGSRHMTLERIIFGLALDMAAEPSSLGQLRQMLLKLHEQQDLPEGFATWALERLDERVTKMALEYAHDAEVLIQLLSFKGGTFASLLQDIDDLYRQEKISQRVYVRVKLMLRDIASPQPE